MSDSQEHRALYLRWRPRTFSEVVGQEHVTRTLRNAVRSGRLAHAYLFCGPRGTGKTSLARILYRAANCTSPRDGEPCAECPTCQAAAMGQALDLVEVDAASNRGIDDIRQLRERVAYSPSQGRYRVYIIDEAHELTGPAWDAFLKTLEEPPAHTIFVLATTEAHKVPPTIVSRCQRFDLRRISRAAIREHLARVGQEEGLVVEPAVLDLLARMARGGLRDALSLLDQLHAYAGERVDLATARAMLGMASAEAVQRFIEALEANDAAGAVDRLAGLIEEGSDLRQFLDEVTDYLRGLLLARSGATARLAEDFTGEELAWLEEHAGRWVPERLLGLTRTLAEVLARVRDPGQLALQVELIVLEGCPMAAAATGHQPAAASEVAATVPTVACPAPATPSVGLQGSGTERPFPPEETEHAQPADWRWAGGPSLPGSETPPSDSPAGGSGPQAVGELDAVAVRAGWSQVMERLRRRNGVVAAMLEAAQVVDCSAGQVTLAFGFTFHQQRVSEEKNRRLVEDTLSEVLGQGVRVRCVHQAVPAKLLSDEDFAAEVDRLLATDPVVRRAVDLWGRNLTIIE